MLRFFIKWALVIAIVSVAFHYWLQHKSYVFNKDTISAIAKKYAGSEDIEKTFKELAAELHKTYPNHILPVDQIETLFTNQGGKMLALKILHMSSSETISFFGTAVQTSGHSGRHFMDIISTTLISGSLKKWDESTFKATTYKSGDVFLTKKFEVSAVELSEGTWGVQYCRGFMLPSIVYSMADTFFSTLDFFSLFKFMKAAGTLFYFECSNCLNHLLGFAA